MKRTLYLKLLISYSLFGIIALILLGTFNQNAIDNFLKQKDAQRLYRESSIIASNLKNSFSDTSISLPDMQKELEILGGYLSARIWIMDSNGNLLLDSQNPSIYTLTQSQITFPIDGFQISDFGNSYYQTGTFYDYFTEKNLTVFSTITTAYNVRGYVLIHKPMSSVLADSAAISNFIFNAAVTVFLCSFIVLLAFSFLVYRPIQKISNAAKNYAKGDFSEKISVHSNDEIGYLAKTLNYMATELDTREEEQRKFISNVSHDFRSPLTSIKGYIEAMIDGTIPPEMQEKYLNIILFETERLNKLTQSLLDLNRFGHHGMMLDITDFDINHIIRTTTQTFEGVCSKKGLSFDLVLTEKQLYVKGDMSKIQQVLYNLIDNATKFSHNNTSITIETSIKNGKVIISVKDCGIGIPSDSIKKVWDRFYKTDHSRGKDKKGTGLGLAIVKEIIQAHKENINVISTEGVGTEFIFTLPLSEKEQI